MIVLMKGIGMKLNKDMDSVNIHGMMAVIMLVIGKIIKPMDLVN